MGKRSSPVRTCVGCRTERPAAELVRCRRGADGDVYVEGQRDFAPGQSVGGRGAWVCPVDACVANATATSAFARAFRARSTVANGAALAAAVRVTYAQKVAGTAKHQE